ncbi:MAG: c-type cytochrome [Thermoguttaceae bacterium]
MEQFHIRSMKIVLLVSSLVFLAFLLIAAFQENFTSEWREHQMAYARLLEDAEVEDETLAVTYPIEVRQIYLEELGHVDRCVTCHVGIDNPAMQGQPIPLASHPGDILKQHPSDKFGCTICHQGQGRATSVADAHADVLNQRGHNAVHWEEPLLAGKMVYTSCGRCHYENDLYGGQSDLYGQTSPIVYISRGELAAELPGAENLARGKRLVVENGCLGCHQYRGRGGTLGPDITHVGDKTDHDFDFQHVHGERTVENWMFVHFKSPSAVVPNTVMPELGLTDDEAHDLAAYMISLKRKSAPASYTPLPREVDPTPVRGETLYKTYCAACHGASGVGAIVRDAEAAKSIDRPRELLTPSLRNIDTLGVASDDYLRAIIANGRPGTSMPAWEENGGLSDDEIDLLVGYIRRWEPREADRSLISASRGDAHYGGALFRANCTGCHGSNGQGGEIGVSLRSPSLLAIASDDLLATTILRGRPNTAMPSWRQFDNRDVSDLLAFIRSWQPLRSVRQEVLESDVLAAAVPPANHVATGRTLYRSRCVVCHGENGEGSIGPSLNNQSVLSVVSNAFLHDMIVRGRPGTAMPAWRQLSSEDVVDLIAFLRSWQTAPAKQLADVHVTGDWQNGALLYQGMCASCHGPEAQGAIGPQLINPVFLESVRDATLVEWISHGRTGTQMRPFLRGLQGTAELSSHQIEDIVTFLRHQTGRQSSDGQRIGIGYAPRGKVLFERACVGCHGPDGEGANGPAIRNPAFLATVSDGFLRATIVLGRDGTEMRSMGHHGGGIVELRADEIDDLVAYLRTAEPQVQPAHRFVIGADPDRGQVLYGRFCVGCHGAEGRGNFAPELNNPGFLRAATDGYLQATIIRGRRGTAMRPFGRGRHGLADLSQGEVNDIVAYVRQWSPDTRPLRRTEPFTKQGTSPTNDEIGENTIGENKITITRQVEMRR